MFASLLLGYAVVTNTEICPLTIQTQQKITAPVGWKVFTRTDVSLLSGISVYFDHPDTKLIWAPDSVKKVDGKNRLTYHLPKQTKAVWVDCSYTKSNLVLRKQLPSSIKQCDAILIRNDTLIESVTCK